VATKAQHPKSSGYGQPRHYRWPRALRAFPRRLAAALEIPVFLSSLIEIPMLPQGIRSAEQIADFQNIGRLTDDLSGACGVRQLDPIARGHSTDLPETQKQFAIGRLNGSVYAAQLVVLNEVHLAEHPDVCAIVAQYIEFPTTARCTRRRRFARIRHCHTGSLGLRQGCAQALPGQVLDVEAKAESPNVTIFASGSIVQQRLRDKATLTLDVSSSYPAVTGQGNYNDTVSSPSL